MTVQEIEQTRRNLNQRAMYKLLDKQKGRATRAVMEEHISIAYSVDIDLSSTF